MKKFIPIVIVGILVLGGLGAAALTTDYAAKKITNQKPESNSVDFQSQPVVTEKDGFVEIGMNGATTQRIIPNQPVLPIYVRAYKIPYGSTNIQVTCTPQEVGTMTLTKQIIPARVSPLSKMSEQTSYVMDASVYGSNELYPATWYNVELSAGRDSTGTVVTFVKVVCYPVRYAPTENQISYTNGFDIAVTYDAPLKTSSPVRESYDMVIIANASFESTLQPLIDEKNAKGVATIFKSVGDILDEYTGTDPPEQIKYFINYAYDTYGITYVLLVGGLKSHINAHDKDTRSAGYTDWWVPVRYVSIPQDDDEGCLSDLYYGCIKNATGFDSWDSNGDGVYAAWDAPGAAKDKFDMNPEVYVSRLPVANTRELVPIVKKIIKYESTGPDAKPWYNTFVGVGGKTFDYFAGKPDGEYLCDLAYNYTKNAIPGLTLKTVYSTNRDTSGLIPDKKGISKAFNQGAGFVDFEGHGSPAKWDTIYFDGTYPKDWVGGIGLQDFWRLRVGDKLPVVIVGGCHNGMYNISVIPGMKDKTGASYYAYGYPVPTCFSWALIMKPFGDGAIASTGCSGFGMGYQGNPVSLSAELESNFFYQIGNGATHLAQAHSLAIQKFLVDEEIQQVEAFVITNWALFGDPSMVFGGYSS